MKTFHDPEVFARVRRLPVDVAGVTARLRDEAIARGVDVVDLALDVPDRGAPAAVVERLRAEVADPRTYRTDPRGLPELRAAAARWWSRRHGVELDPERELLVTAGSSEGVGHALLGLLTEGETLLAPAPAPPILANGAVLAGAEAIPFRVEAGGSLFEAAVEATERAERRPKGIVVSSPSDPTGAVAAREDLEKVVRFAEARGLFIVSDLSLGELVFDGGRATAVLSIPGARERTIEFVSLARSHGMAGWRVGFCAGTPALVAVAARVRSYLGQGPSGAAQLAAVVALDACDAEVAANRERYQRRRDALVAALGAVGWAVPPPAATPFAWAPIPEPFRALGSLEFARRLLQDAGVCVAPGIGFGPAGEGFVRISLVEDAPRLQLAAERIHGFLQKGR